MYLSNAARWSELCDKQIAILDGLAHRFPERKEHIASLSYTWAAMQQHIKEGKNMDTLAL